MSKPIYFGTSPVPPPGYKAIEIPQEENPEIQKKRNAISAGILSNSKSGRTNVSFNQRMQIPAPLIRRG